MSKQTKAKSRDNIIRGINKTLKQYFDIFGGQSKEYMRVYKEATDIVKGSGAYASGHTFIDDMPTEPLQLSRSKSSQATDKMLFELRNNQLNQPTANQSAIAYYIVLTGNYKKRLNADDKTKVKKTARTIYIVYNNSVEIYDTLRGTEYEDEASYLYSEYNLAKSVSRKNEMAERILELYKKAKQEQQQQDMPHVEGEYDLDDYDNGNY